MTTDGFSRVRPDQMINLRHPLAELASPSARARSELSLAPSVLHRDRKGRVIECHGLFGLTRVVASAGLSPAGLPRLTVQLMSSPLYLQAAFSVSDESVVER